MQHNGYSHERGLTHHFPSIVTSGVATAVAVAFLRFRNGGKSKRTPLQNIAALIIVGISSVVFRQVVQCLLDIRRRGRRRFLRLTSLLSGSSVKQATPEHDWTWSWSSWSWLGPSLWHGFCPCCKRPVEACLSEERILPSPLQDARGKYAFLICLWGESPNFVMGAMVLGHSLKRTGSPHARVCMYTDDVPAEFVRLLSVLWDCRRIEHVNAANVAFNFSTTENRFDKVFTKLNGMRLTEFEKVLMMDIDLLVRSNIDDLFELPAPAAMRRGRNDSYQHGQVLDSRCFFLGHENDKWSWGQGNGINAGVMLWKPDEDVYQQMLSEITDPNHPEHVKGHGPEQDYLSRYWADAPWRHLSVEYNFQVHQMFFGLHPERSQGTKRSALLLAPENIKIVHYSGESKEKPWHRVLDSQWAEYWPNRSRDTEYSDLFGSYFDGYHLWVKPNREFFDAAAKAPVNYWDFKELFMGEDQRVYRKTWDSAGAESAEIAEAPAGVVQGAVGFLHTVLCEWFDALQELEAELGYELRVRLLRAKDSTPPRPKELVAPPGWNVCESTNKPWLTGQPSHATAQQFSWQRHGGRGGWWVECDSKQNSSTDTCGVGIESTEPLKLSVVCGELSGQCFVKFAEAGTETFAEDDKSGVFVKVIGPHATRRIALPDMPAGADDDAWALALTPLRLWVEMVPPGAAVLLAFLCVAPDAMVPILTALAPLGVPQVPPPQTCRAFAAIGSRPSDRSNGLSDCSSDFLFASHAASDIAYASMFTLAPSTVQ